MMPLMDRMTRSVGAASKYSTIGVGTVLLMFLLTMPEGIRAGSEIENGYAPDAETAVAAPVPDSCRITSHEGGEVGNRALAVTLPAQGKFIFAPGPRNPGFTAIADGALGIKVGWERHIEGQLTLSGRRLDGRSAPLRAQIPGGYGAVGFQPVQLIFPTPGCWEVKGTVGSASLTVVVFVIKVGQGPTARMDA
jgi:hypothetical protein